MNKKKAQPEAQPEQSAAVKTEKDLPTEVWNDLADPLEED